MTQRANLEMNFWVWIFMVANHFAEYWFREQILINTFVAPAKYHHRCLDLMAVLSIRLWDGPTGISVLIKHLKHLNNLHLHKSFAAIFFILPSVSEIIRKPLRAFSSAITFCMALSKATFIWGLRSSCFLAYSFPFILLYTSKLITSSCAPMPLETSVYWIPELS